TQEVGMGSLDYHDGYYRGKRQHVLRQADNQTGQHYTGRIFPGTGASRHKCFGVNPSANHTAPTAGDLDDHLDAKTASAQSLREIRRLRASAAFNRQGETASERIA